MPHLKRALVLLALLLAGTAGSNVALASCMDDVQQLTSRLGLVPQAPANRTGGEAPATTESRGISPEITSRLNGTGAAAGNTVAAKRTEVLASIQAARAAAAQGNEQECETQINKARNILTQPQP